MFLVFSDKKSTYKNYPIASCNYSKVMGSNCPKHLGIYLAKNYTLVKISRVIFLWQTRALTHD